MTNFEANKNEILEMIKNGEASFGVNSKTNKVMSCNEPCSTCLFVDGCMSPDLEQQVRAEWLNAEAKVTLDQLLDMLEEHHNKICSVYCHECSYFEDMRCESRAKLQFLYDNGFINKSKVQ